MCLCRELTPCSCGHMGSPRQVLSQGQAGQLLRVQGLSGHVSSSCKPRGPRFSLCLNQSRLLFPEGPSGFEGWAGTPRGTAEPGQGLKSGVRCGGTGVGSWGLRPVGVCGWTGVQDGRWGRGGSPHPSARAGRAPRLARSCKPVWTPPRGRAPAFGLRPLGLLDEGGPDGT